MRKVIFAGTLTIGLILFRASLSTERRQEQAPVGVSENIRGETTKVTSDNRTPQTFGSEVKNVSLEPLYQDRAWTVKRVRQLSKKFFRNTQDQLEITNLLRSPQAFAAAERAFNDPRSLGRSQSRERMHALDLVYEALKNTAPDVFGKYAGLVHKALTAEVPVSLAPDSYEAQQFFGDRVEVVLVLMKIENAKAKNLFKSLSQEKGPTHSYFSRAEEMAALYEVTL